MAIVTGVVEAVSTKYDKYGILVDGTWYSTKIEWAKVKPEQGDKVTFENGGGKFMKSPKIIGHSEGNSGSSSGSSSGAPAKNYNLGVELGHASNLAMRMTEYLANSTDPQKFLDEWEGLTQSIYDRMARLRKMYEEGEVVAGAKKEYLEDELAKLKPKAKAKAKEDIEDDDIPF